jgi:hypothetical protein
MVVCLGLRQGLLMLTTGVLGDAEMLINALGQNQHFETLLNGSDKAVADACLKLALPSG